MFATYSKSDCCDQSTEEATPHGFDAEGMAHFLLILVRRVLQIEYNGFTSMENSTPPIGDPKATATPAALEAVKISRIFPTQEIVNNGKSDYNNTTNLDSVKIE